MKSKRVISILAVTVFVLVSACSTQTNSPAAPTAPAATPTPAIVYPEKPISMIVGFPPGGPVDQVARALAEAAKPYLPQPITIVNKGGGGGTVGAAEVVRSKPDGYTINLAYNGAMTLQPHLTPDLPFKTPDDYQLVIGVSYAPTIFIVKADSQFKTLKDVVDYAKANPGKFRAANSGMGTFGHLAVELFEDKAKIDLTNVPFDGAAPSLTALLGGHIEGSSANPGGVMAQVQAGQVRVLGVFADKRSPVFPDVPTFREQGYDILSLAQEFVLVPKGTPEPVVKILHDSFKKALESDSFKEFTSKQGFTIDYKDGATLKKQLQAEYDSFAELAKKLNLKG